MKLLQIPCLAVAAVIAASPILAGPAAPRAATGAAPARPAAPSDMLVDALTAWLVAEQGLPMPSTRPRVALVPARELAEMRYPGLPSEGPKVQSRAGGRETIAVYDPLSRTIFLQQGWSGRTPAELSILVHELVHHLQASAGLRFACVGASEEAAFEAQERWLALFGGNLQDDFSIDPFTRMVVGLCN